MRCLRLSDRQPALTTVGSMTPISFSVLAQHSDVHVFADDPVVRVALPLCAVNLGGRGRVRCQWTAASADDLRRWAEHCCSNSAGPLAMPEGATDHPRAMPDRIRAPDLEPAALVETESSACGRIVSNYKSSRRRTVLRDNLSTATITVPSSNRTRTAITGSTRPAVVGILPGDSSHRGIPATVLAMNRPALRPSPTRQLIFYWSKMGDVEMPLPAEAQAAISCLADLSSELIYLRYHVSYRVLSGQLDSLAWYVPRGPGAAVRPRAAAFFLSVSSAARRRAGHAHRLSRPQAEDFSLTATFVEEMTRHADPVRLSLVDPLRLEDPLSKKINLRFHQFALRHPSDLQIEITAAGVEQIVKSRSVDQFLKEWNADGARPQQAFELDRAFALNLVIEKKSISPAVRGSSVGRIHPGRLDWVYSAEVEQPIIPRFVYRLQIDPRLQIRDVSVQEEGAERLLRLVSPTCDTLILFLNDRQATRTQTVRVDSESASRGGPGNRIAANPFCRGRSRSRADGLVPRRRRRSPPGQPQRFSTAAGQCGQPAGSQGEQLVVRLDASCPNRPIRQVSLCGAAVAARLRRGRNRSASRRGRLANDGRRCVPRGIRPRLGVRHRSASRIGRRAGN